MIIPADELTLRSTSADDPELKSLLQDPSVWRNLSETRLYPEPMPSRQVFRIEHEGKLLGEISLTELRWFNRKATLSIYLAPEHQGQGHGRRATLALMRHAFHTLNLHRLQAEAIEFNTASIALLEGLGFILEGRYRQAKYSAGRYWDILCYGLLRPEYEARYGPGDAAAPEGGGGD